MKILKKNKEMTSFKELKAYIQWSIRDKLAGSQFYKSFPCSLTLAFVKLHLMNIMITGWSNLRSSFL